jgi:class 3 adenylate cyclase
MPPMVQPEYANFVPARLALRHATGGGEPQAAEIECVQGAVAFADIIGYTALTESYASRGPEGIEKLSRLLHDFFARLESIVVACGGDIMGYSGDSALVLWADLADSEEAARLFAERAQGSLVLCDESTGVALRVRVTVVSGDFQLATVGGVGGQWHYLVTGVPFESLARKGLDPERSGTTTSSKDKTFRETAGTLSPRLVASRNNQALRRYIPPPVLDHFDARHHEWMSEYRDATTMFAGWDGVDCVSPGSLVALQAAVVAIQQIVARFGGNLLQVIVDDKGANSLSVWGAPGRQHEDDAARAARAGLAIEARFRAHGLRASVGIATGRILCGLKGGGMRYDYGPAGSSVNLAARLMDVTRDSVVCDAPTVHRAMRHLAFEPLGRFKVKGRELPCDAFRALDRLPANQPALRDERARSVLIGRSLHLGRLTAKLRGLPQGQGGALILSGEPGIGKTSLLREFSQAAESMGIACLVSRADSVESHTLYYPWRSVMQSLLRRETLEDPAAWRSYVEDALRSQLQLHAWRALLNDVVPLGFDETSMTRSMSEQARAEGAAEIVVRIFEGLLARRPVVIVLDDAQWMDSLSWALVAQLRQRLPRLLVVIALRHGDALASDPNVCSALFAQAERVELQLLSQEETAALLCVRLGVHTVADDIVSLVYGKAAGNPFFCEEVTLAMLQGGQVVVQGDHCALGAQEPNRNGSSIGDTLQSVIASRIDLLPAEFKDSLKVASVLGDGFSLELLAALVPEVATRDELDAQLKCFIGLDLLVRQPRSSGPLLSFRHGITREVAYSMLTVADRRRLHGDVATWLERLHAHDLSAFFPLLAYHWEQAGNREATLEYLYKAGEQATERFANREGSDFLRRALAMLKGDVRPQAVVLRARCEQLLGNALLWMGRLPESRTHLQNSVSLRGYVVPSSRAGKVLSVTAQLAALLVKRVLRLPSTRQVLSLQERETAMAMLRLGHIAYFQEDILLMIFTSVRCVDFATRVEECRESALMLAALASAAGSVPLHRVAVSCGDRALRVAAAFGDACVTSQAYQFAAIYRAGIGDWEVGLQRIVRARQLSEASGDNRRREECMVIEGYLHFHAGLCANSLEMYESAAQLARVRGDLQTWAWGLLGVARVHIRMERWDNALVSLRAAQDIAFDRVSLIELRGQLALVHLRRGESRLSLAAARDGLTSANSQRPTSFATLTGLRGVAEALVELWAVARAEARSDDARALGREVRAALAALRRFTRIFPIGAPRWRLLQARQQDVLGHAARSVRLCRQAHALARQLGMPDEQAHAIAALQTHGVIAESGLVDAGALTISLAASQSVAGSDVHDAESFAD